MILLIDNYDSFSYNVFQLVGSVNPDIRVIRNDECSVDEIRAMNPSHIILSPGPGRPDKAGVCENVIRELGGRIPITRRRQALPITGICQKLKKGPWPTSSGRLAT